MDDFYDYIGITPLLDAVIDYVEDGIWEAAFIGAEGIVYVYDIIDGPFYVAYHLGIGTLLEFIQIPATRDHALVILDWLLDD